VIGEVAGLDLRWYEDKALFGRTVVVTRASHQAPALSRRLEELGACVIEIPVIGLAPPADGGAALASGVARLQAGEYSWVAFTSANAVHRFFNLVPDTRQLGRVLVAAVGASTAGALRGYRVVADLVPDDFQGRGLAEKFPPPPPRPGSGRVLVPQAAGAGPELPDGLKAKGWDVDVVEAYRTAPEAVSEDLLRAGGEADAICFASSSAVDSYLDQASNAGAAVPPVVACIGPVTAATARARGLEVSAEASEHTLDGLVTVLSITLTGGLGKGRWSGKQP